MLMRKISSKQKSAAFLTGILVTQFVNSALHLIQPLLIADLSGSLAHAAFFSSFDTAVHMAGTFMGGWPTDRFGPRKVLIVAVFFRAISLAAIPLFLFLGNLTIFKAMFWYTVDAFVRGFVDSSEHSLPLEFCEHDRQELDRLNSKFEFVFDLGGFAGPLVLGFLMLSHGGVVTHAILPMGFLLAALIFCGIPKVKEQTEYPKTDSGIEVGTWQGLRWILNDKKLQWAVLGLVFFNVYPLRKLLGAFYAKSILLNPSMVGFIGAAFGLGGMSGALIYNYFRTRRTDFQWIFYGALGLIVLAVGWIPEKLIVMCVAAYLFAVTNTAARLSLTRLRQERTPMKLLGGVTAASRFAANAASVSLKGLLGVLFGLGFDARWGFSAVSVCFVLLALMQLRVKTVLSERV